LLIGNQSIKVLKGSTSYKVRVPIFTKVQIEQEINPEGEDEKKETTISYFKLGSVFDISQTSEYENY